VLIQADANTSLFVCVLLERTRSLLLDATVGERLPGNEADEMDVCDFI
jgi:hypothetical protein